MVACCAVCDQKTVDEVLAWMVQAVCDDCNIVALMLDVVRAEVILGEICAVFKLLWGEYWESVCF